MSLSPVACVEILDGGLLLTFEDGEGRFLSPTVLHRAVDLADQLPEFSEAEIKALTL
jgi:hypothetical protein